MVRADVMRGHLATFVDVGPSLSNGTQQPARIGQVDNRGGFRLVTSPPEWADSADLIVYHTGAPDGWVARNQAPIVWVVHGRPLASFRPEQNNSPLHSYSLYATVAAWPRVKKMLYFWPEFTPYWEVILPASKLAPLDWPAIDLERFSPDGPKHEFSQQHRGRWNALICDSWRQDIDCFEITSGAIEAAKLIPGLKVHFYSIETVPGTNVLQPCWDLLTTGLRRLGSLGELSGRQNDMEQVYRAVDFVMTPNRIVTRVVGEALACGIPVLAPHGCKVTPWQADMGDPHDIARVTVQLVNALQSDSVAVKKECLHTARQFGLARFGQAVEQVYQEAIHAA